MRASNVPSIPAPVAGVPARTYADVVAGRNLGNHEVAKALAVRESETEWAPVLSVSDRAFRDTDHAAAHAKVVMGRLGDSLTEAYSLIVRDNTVHVLYAWRACRALDPEGRRYAGLIGEGRGGEGCYIPPKLFITKPTPAERQHQYQTFQRMLAAPASMAAIQAALAADGNLTLVPPAVGVDGIEPEQIGTWKVFPVHAKVAALFLRGVPLREAVDLAVSLYQTVPEADRDATEGLMEFMRVAITPDENLPTRSILHTEWVRQDTAASDELEDWYLRLVQMYAPRFNPPPEVVPQAPVAPAQGAPGLAPGAVLLPEGMAGERAVEARPKRPYTQNELAFLCRLSGEDPMAPGDITPDLLPSFWQEFERSRAKLPTAREFIESYLDNNWPANEPQAQRFVSTSLVQCLVALDFHGGDVNMMPSKRSSGLSVYAIYPLEDDADTGHLRIQAMAFEETMDTHTPEHREAMSKLTAAVASTPAHREKLWRWVKYYATVLRLLFGPHMIALAPLRRFAEFLGQVVPFRHYQPNQFRALFWKYHCGMRHIFRPGQGYGDPTEAFNDLLARLRQGVPIYPDEVPQELIAPTLAPKPPPLGPPNPRHGKPPKQPQESSLTKGVVERIAKVTGPAVQAAIDAARKVNVKLSTREMFPNGLEEALGDMKTCIRPTAAGQQTACPRLFIYGRCTIKQCRHSHALTREPSHGNIKHFTDWVERRAAQLKENPKA